MGNGCPFVGGHVVEIDGSLHALLHTYTCIYVNIYTYNTYTCACIYLYISKISYSTLPKSHSGDSGILMVNMV